MTPDSEAEMIGGVDHGCGSGGIHSTLSLWFSSQFSFASTFCCSTQKFQGKSRLLVPCDRDGANNNWRFMWPCIRSGGSASLQYYNIESAGTLLVFGTAFRIHLPLHDAWLGGYR